MLRLVFIIILFVGFDFCLKGQNRKKIGPGLWIEKRDLTANKISSITFTEYEYINKDKKVVSKQGKINKVELYDNLGREVEARYYNDSTEKLSVKNIYFYSDTSIYFNRWEQYNDKDSLISVTFPKDMVSGTLSMAFGHYEYVYGEKGLISEAVFYYNECGSCSKPRMKPVRLIKLKYTFYP